MRDAGVPTASFETVSGREQTGLVAKKMIDRREGGVVVKASA